MSKYKQSSWTPDKIENTESNGNQADSETDTIKLSNTSLVAYKNKENDPNQLNIKFQTLIFIYILIKIFIYSRISYAQTTKYFVVVCVCVFSTILAEFLYNILVNKKDLKNSFFDSISGYAKSEGLIIACTLNFGFHLFPVFITSFCAIIFARLVYGGKDNIFSVPAFAIVLIYTSFTNMAQNLSMNGSLDKVLLSIFGSENSYHIAEISNLKDIISLNRLPYLDFSSIFMVFVVITFFLIAYKVLSIDSFVPTRIILFLLILSYSFTGFLNATSQMNSNVLYFNGFLKYIINYNGIFSQLIKSILLFFYLTAGPTIVGIILYTVFSPKMPTTIIGKYIVSFIIAVIIFYTKFFTDNSFGVFYAILLCNGLTPMLDEIIISSQNNKNITIIFITIISFALGFFTFLYTMRGI